MNFPNLLTSIRILLIPVFILLFLPPNPSHPTLAAVIFTLASITDLLDGYLARRWKQITRLGKLLDPIADKLLILSALILLVDFNRVPAWIAIILIGREVAITGLRAIASSEGIVIPADTAGKYKLFIQVLAIVLLILNFETPYFSFLNLGIILLWAAMILAILSAIQYVILYSGQIQNKRL
jgi:CDP-diacylglycerol---glycerol-3-phosphate 3-phosphatidyltransferase